MVTGRMRALKISLMHNCCVTRIQRSIGAQRLNGRLNRSSTCLKGKGGQSGILWPAYVKGLVWSGSLVKLTCVPVCGKQCPE